MLKLLGEFWLLMMMRVRWTTVSSYGMHASAWHIYFFI